MMRFRGLYVLVACGAAAVTAVACSGSSTDTASTAPAAKGPFNTEVPCDVAKILATHCLKCHSDPPTMAAPESLMTYAQVTGPSLTDPAQSEAQIALGRIQSSVSPMPPRPEVPLSAAEIATWQAWVDAGAPKGHCSGPDDTSSGTGGAAGSGPGGMAGSGGSAGSAAGAGGSAGGGDAGAGGGATATPLPCDIATIFSNRCNGCHSTPPGAGSPMSLGSVEDLLAPAPSDPTMRVADLVVARLSDATKPMPPLPQDPATAAEIAAITDWVAAGLPPGTCLPGGPTDGGTGGNPYLMDPVCTSGVHWPGTTASAFMGPGEACVACHKKDGAFLPIFAGTVYPTAHEPSDCNGINGLTTFKGATVTISDSAGHNYTLPVNSAGNFYLKVASGYKPPYTAQVSFNGKVRQMVTPQSSGDCNSCHTQDGTTTVTNPPGPLAPGRILVP